MLTIGLAMLAAVVAMLTVARPQNDKPVHWLQSESRQQGFGFAIVLLLTVGGLLAVGGAAR